MLYYNSVSISSKKNEDKIDNSFIYGGSQQFSIHSQNDTPIFRKNADFDKNTGNLVFESENVKYMISIRDVILTFMEDFKISDIGVDEIKKKIIKENFGHGNKGDNSFSIVFNDNSDPFMTNDIYSLMEINKNIKKFESDYLNNELSSKSDNDKRIIYKGFYQFIIEVLKATLKYMKNNVINDELSDKKYYDKYATVLVYQISEYSQKIIKIVQTENEHISRLLVNGIKHNLLLEKQLVDLSKNVPKNISISNDETTTIHKYNNSDENIKMKNLSPVLEYPRYTTDGEIVEISII